jgi:hypothetical protein
VHCVAILAGLLRSHSERLSLEDPFWVKRNLVKMGEQALGQQAGKQIASIQVSMLHRGQGSERKVPCPRSHSWRGITLECEPGIYLLLKQGLPYLDLLLEFSIWFSPLVLLGLET